MKFTIFYKRLLIFIIFSSSLVIGLYFNEDLSGGAIYDYNIHKRTIIDLFEKGLGYGLLNYDEFTNTHSPLFIIILNFLISKNELFGRLFYILISSSIIIVFYKSLILKYKTNSILLFLLSNFFLLSPYFRSYSIWPGDETIALIFFCFSIYFCLKFILLNKNLTIYVILNVISLAIASYLRPIYCIFSIFYFFLFFFNNKFNLKIFFLYLILNILLAFPAFYYVFVLDITFFFSYFGAFNIVTSLALVYLTIFFYLTPLIILDIKNTLFRFNFINFLITIFISMIVLFFFNYEWSSGGGFYYKLSQFLFNNNILVYLFFPFAFYYCNQILELNKIRNLILFLLLIIIEMDGHFYMESYDPLFYVLFFTLFDLKITRNFSVNLSKTVFTIFVFQIFLLFLKFYQLNFINDFKLI